MEPDLKQREERKGEGRRGEEGGSRKVMRRGRQSRGVELINE